MPETTKRMKSLFVTIVSALLIVSFLQVAFHQQFLNFYNAENAIIVHNILEIFSICVSFAIFTYGWFVFRETHSKMYLMVASIFLAVALLDLMHVITYEKTYHLAVDHSGQMTVWFWITARLTESLGLLWVLLHKEKESQHTNQGWIFFSAFIYVCVISSSIFLFHPYFPAIIQSNSGPTPLKIGIEYFVGLTQLLAIFIAYRKYREAQESFHILLMLACSFLLLSELLLTLYTHVNDIEIIWAHFYKVIGYILFLNAFYFSKLRLTYTMKNKVEKDLKKAKGQLESFFQYTPDAIIILDTKGTILSVNPSFEKIFGWKSKDVLGKLFINLMPDPEIKMDIKQLFEKVALGQSFIGHEAIRQRLNGEKFLISTTISPVCNEKGEITQISAIIRDITKQRESENRARKAEQELKEAVSKQTGIIIKFKKENNRFIHTLCDGKLLANMNLTPDMVVGKDLFEIFDAETAGYISTYYEIAWGGEEVSYELSALGAICFVTLSPIIVDGKVTEVVGSSFDISKLKTTEDLLQKSEKLAVVGELAAGVAHEIRNPLTTLKGFVQLMGANVEPEKKAFVDLMLSELDRIEMITNEFMVVAKPQAVRYQEHDIKDLIRQVLLFSNPQAILNNVSIDVSYLTHETIILCDGNQIKQVFINLIKNAFEAMGDGGAISIEVLQSDDSQLLIRITDTGSGIPEEIIPKLGEPFYTLKEKGTGLGLMVSFRIIEAHKGSIHFSSKVNEGTTVDIKLPYPNRFLNDSPLEELERIGIQ
ncbi:hypothetical protein GCM10008967_03690 [Bacillus carboniphilus]|uniref:histidine kinase n=1 Tax=Bacillus carboniphilus TaxID=86663 RepID=A0ABN0VSS5_9BACI